MVAAASVADRHLPAGVAGGCSCVRKDCASCSERTGGKEPSQASVGNSTPGSCTGPAMDSAAVHSSVSVSCFVAFVADVAATVVVAVVVAAAAVVVSSAAAVVVVVVVVAVAADVVEEVAVVVEEVAVVVYAFVAELEDAEADVAAVVVGADAEFSADEFGALVAFGSAVQTAVCFGLAAVDFAVAEPAVVAIGVASSWPRAAFVGAHAVADGHALVD